MLAAARHVLPGRFTLAKFIELARRERNQSPQELASCAGVQLGDVVALEMPQWPTPEAHVIELVAGALGVDPLPLLELSDLHQMEDGELHEIALQFAARLEPVEPLEPQEREALSWLRRSAFARRT
jgi:transcriptional regulator with XRE-family HTH domain